MQFPNRQSLISHLIGAQVPRLWCPPITHYTDSGEIDTARMAAHWRTMTPYVGGFLVPGSTGDGWEMDLHEVDALIMAALEVRSGSTARLLIGALHAEAEAMVTAILHASEILTEHTGEKDVLGAMTQAHVCGFAVCPPRGADLTQGQIRAGLETVLDLGVPTALYQLPQFTQNEMSPALVADLAEHYPNILLFKDTSGDDRVPNSDRGHSGMILVRGAEAEYAQWLRESGGPYHGWLLSTANSFPAKLHDVITLLETGHHEEAHTLSQTLSGVFYAMADLVSDLPHGNLYANANKAMDHWMAHGPAAPDVPPPMLHAGVRLPKDLIVQTGDVLARANLMPENGYLS